MLSSGAVQHVWQDMQAEEPNMRQMYSRDSGGNKMPMWFHVDI